MLLLQLVVVDATTSPSTPTWSGTAPLMEQAVREIMARDGDATESSEEN